MRRPVVTQLPPILIWNEVPARTPVIEGKIARPLADLLPLPDVTPEDVEASIRRAELNPAIDPVWTECHEDLLKASLAYFAAEVISGPPELPYDGKFLIGKHHQEWDELIHKHDKLVLEAARDHGKCRVAGSLVQAADGRRVPVELWTGGEVIAYDRITYKLVPAQATGAKLVGLARCFKITTRTGRTETVADWHRFATVDGWVHADKIQVGQRIAVPRTLPTTASAHWRPGLSWLLGLLLGDGGFLAASPGLTASDGAVVDAATGVAASVGWELTGGDGQYRLTQRWVRCDSPIEWIRELGLDGAGSYDKRVPDDVFQLDNEEIAEIIAGWIDSDGNVNEHGGGCIEIYTVSERLARDGLHLLTRLGVVAVLAPKRGKYKGEDHWSWRLTIRGRSITRLARQVKPRGIRGERLVRVAAIQEEKAEGGSIDLLPKEVCSWLEHGKDWTHRRGGPTFERTYDMTRDKAKIIADLQGNDRLARLAQAEILWDEVVEVERAGDHDVYAIQVPEHETYVGQDIINHNSYFFSLAYPIWRAGYTHPGKLGYIFSATQPLATAFLAMVKDECCANERLRHLVPLSVTDPRAWGSAAEMTFRNGSTIRARGMGVKVRGGHPYWAVADDILEDDDIYSETIRTRHIDYFLSAINNMVVPGGQLVTVGTPMHFADLYGYLKETGEYYCAKYPAIDSEGRLLFPERYDSRLLAKRKRELGSLARFAREFLCQPLSDEASLFPSALFEGGDVRIPYRLGLGHRFWAARGAMVYTGVDFAMSASSGADYTVIFSVAKDQKGNRWIANIRRGKGWGFQRQLDEIKEEYAIMRPGVIHAEANQMQRIFSDELRRETDIPIRKFYTTGVQPKQPWRKGMTQIAVSKHHLDRGVPSLRMSLENRKWRIPRGDQQAIELTDIWMGELQAMSWQQGKVVSVGTHDDTVMATWMCDTAIQLGGFTFSFGDDEVQADIVPPPPAEMTAVDRAMFQVPRSLPSARETESPETVDNSLVDPYVTDNRPEPQNTDDAWKPQQGAPPPGHFGAGTGFGGNF